MPFINRQEQRGLPLGDRTLGNRAGDLFYSLVRPFMTIAHVQKRPYFRAATIISAPRFTRPASSTLAMTARTLRNV